MTNSPTNLENMRLAAAAIREWMPETLPANEAGQVHFARALAESAAEAIEQFISSSPTNLENAERAEMTMTPHAYAQEYEFRGDTDYTPSDFERTMIEDAILGYLGEARIAERAEMEPKVKPLEWRVEGENRNGPWLWEASSIVKGYTIRHMPNELYKLDGHGEWATLKAAKAAAQSDYEARIRSCLLDKPEAVEDAFDQIVAARKAHVDAVTAYNARLEFVRAERERGNWLTVDREYAAMAETQRAFHRLTQELADAALTHEPTNE